VFLIAHFGANEKEDSHFETPVLLGGDLSFLALAGLIYLLGML
jgi:hypothetical protein